ncbi:MAG: TlpA family protein disulfide reductase [Azoarcus sp.]|jgi:thiol-disulfide isomerase/thioredoxin|nr:TlpA family protein disulfide reductase [Azoarcus sp.]
MKAAKRFLGVILFALMAVGTRAEEPSGQGLETLFSMTMKDTHGQPMSLSRFRGQPLIVNFWARVCPPCREEIPELTALQSQYGKRGLVVLGIALENDPEKVREFLAAYDAGYLAALTGEQEGYALMRALGNAESFLPFTLLIDRKGEVVLNKRGIFREGDFQGVAKKLLP